MNLEPLSGRPLEISVTAPVSTAYGRMKRILFQPFDLGKWFVIGFCAWLAGLGERGTGGAGGGGNGRSRNFENGNVADQLRHGYELARNYVMANLNWLLPVVIAAMVIGLGLWLLFLWLNCRGKFMLLHCVALNRAEVEVPWVRYGAVADRLFGFRIGLCVASLVTVLPVLGLVAYLILRMILDGEASAPAVMGLIALVCGFFCLIVAWGVVQKFLVDFVVPIMYLRGGSCLAASREFAGLLSARPAIFVLYILFQMVLYFVLGAAIVTIFLLTCCTACCVAMLPYIGTVFLLPVLVFQRAYSLCFLAQLGPDYDVFPPEPPAAAPPPAPGLRPL